MRWILTSNAAGSPRLGFIDTIEQSDWIALVLTDVEGQQPVLPWASEQLAEVLEALDQMAHVLTPVAAPTIAVQLGDVLTGWRTLAAAPRLDGLDAWSRAHLDRLVSIEADWERCAAGTTMLHTDLRADNVLLTDHGAVLVDWPGACIGAAFVDLVLFAPSVAMQDGPAPAELLALSRTGRAVDTKLLRPIVCALAGYFTERSLQPPPPGIPTVRAFQAAQATVARQWLADIL